ncbi:hypothetical protein J5N97_029266 [Dioscorea zingiberensis]|uniref:Uncharacterized protein n=1 Tax=Dioscorea zingiberensis TaxID=325984 RepID=A0A9D5H5G4_9LILI|nr:hypothetical protein J5N97_029266 [Dioscorea zingiberensis]
MGNCVGVFNPKRGTTWHCMEEEEQVLRIVKVDGKVLEYSTSVLVRDLISKFDGYGIGVSRGSSRCLTPEHELRVGRVYYLLPLAKDSTDHEDQKKSDDIGVSRRIKVVLTKQQVQELLSRLQNKEEESGSYGASWKPQLETIFEEVV